MTGDGNHWTVFNGAGAVVVDGVSAKEAHSYLNDRTLERGWTAVGCEIVNRDNPPMAQSVAERQRAFKASMKAAGYVKLEAWVTKEQRDKFRQIGGDEWLRKKIEAAKTRPTNGA